MCALGNWGAFIPDDSLPGLSSFCAQVPTKRAQTYKQAHIQTKTDTRTDRDRHTYRHTDRHTYRVF
jgi:hypothetical protein